MIRRIKASYTLVYEKVIDVSGEWSWSEAKWEDEAEDLSDDAFDIFETTMEKVAPDFMSIDGDWQWEDNMNDLTQEDRCELNNIRNEIEKMPSLTAGEKLGSLSVILRGLLELYTAENTLGTARYELELCRKRDEGRRL